MLITLDAASIRYQNLVLINVTVLEAIHCSYSTGLRNLAVVA